MNRERRRLARSEFAATTYARYEADEDRKRREKVDREGSSPGREEERGKIARRTARSARGRSATLTRSSG